MTTPVKIASPTESAERKALEPADVTVNITHFQNVLATDLPTNRQGIPLSRCTGHSLKMKKHSRVRLKKETLLIKPKGATLRFTIEPKNYFPIAIAFVMLKGSPHPTDIERLGLLNFSQASLRPETNSISVTDHFKDKEKDDRYTFSIIIQNGNDGTIGIVDPSIEHER